MLFEELKHRARVFEGRIYEHVPLVVELVLPRQLIVGLLLRIPAGEESVRETEALPDNERCVGMQTNVVGVVRVAAERVVDQSAKEGDVAAGTDRYVLIRNRRRSIEAGIDADKLRLTAALRFDDEAKAHSVARLTGAPPGYVGYGEGGQLTETVRRKPYCVVLFDEIEKAHPDVIQLLLQVLEDGRLTDSLGRTVDFRNTIIIMTSNVGAQILQRGSALGFGSSDEVNKAEKIKEKILEESKRIFKPEFLNRVNELVVFRSLTREHLFKIVHLELRKVGERLQEQAILLDVGGEAKEFLIDKGYDEKYGARPLRRAVEQHLEDPLAEAILRGDLKKGEPIQVGVEEDRLSFTQNLPTSKVT